MSEPPHQTVPGAPVRIAVVAPTFNHAEPLGDVLDRLDTLGLDIIVVNDGSTDATADVLDRWRECSPASERQPPPFRGLVSHACNLGKAAALLSGFDEARARGFTHALTIDTDGQHDAADVPALISLAERCPDALILGERVVGNDPYPRLSRFGRWFSNLGVRLESGLRVEDSQSGMRVYPLGVMGSLALRDAWARRYGFETQVLTLAAWAGVPVERTAIRCIYRVPGGRRSHFRVVRDSLSALAMHAGLAVRAHRWGPPLTFHDGTAIGTIPRRLARWFSPRRIWSMARGDPVQRERFAASLGVGLFMATVPAYGVKTVVCLWLSHRLRLHPLVVVAVSSLSTPPLGLIFAVASIAVGHVLLRGSPPSALRLHDISIGLDTWRAMRDVLAEWIIGSVVVGVALGMLGYLTTRWMLLRRPSGAARATASP